MTLAPPIWVISDTHFLLDDAGYRPADADGFIVGSWTGVVGPEDTVLHLGDVGQAASSTRYRLWNLLRALPGRVTLVPGNWDGPEVLEVCQAAGWSLIRSPALTVVEVAGRLVELSHYPSRELAYPWLSVHGHLHRPGSPPYEPSSRHINVAVANRGWRPVRLEEAIRARLNGLSPDAPTGI